VSNIKPEKLNQSPKAMPESKLALREIYPAWHRLASVFYDAMIPYNTAFNLYCRFGLRKGSIFLTFADKEYTLYPDRYGTMMKV